MSLATRCPHCKTVFLVSEELLRLRSGTVRCGICRQTFDGTTGLIGRIANKHSQNLPVSHPEKVVSEPDAPTAALQENMSNAACVYDEQQAGETLSSGNTLIHSDEAIRETFNKQLKTISLALDDFSASIQSENDSPDETNPPLTEEFAEIRPENGSSADIHAEQDNRDEKNLSDTPDISSGNLVGTSTHQKRRKSRISGVFWAIGAIFLLLVLCGQLLYQYSGQIVLWWPPAENMVGTACKLLACPAKVPASIPLQVEYSELTATENSNDKFTQQIVIVNSSTSRQLWPSLVMEISDAQSGNVLSRRVFRPEEYLLDSHGIDKEWLPSGKTVFQLNIEYQHDSAINSRITLINR